MQELLIPVNQPGHHCCRHNISHWRL